MRASGRRGGQRGRKPVAYVVSSRAGFVVGGDIGGSNVRVAAANLFGEPICDVKRPTTKDGSRAVGVQVLEMVSEVMDRASAVHGRPLALGISSPGIVDRASGRVTSLAYNVAPEGAFDPLEVIRDRFDLPVLVENNVNLAAVGEKWFGLARGVSMMVFIAVGAGIGMGIIIEDELVRGAHAAAGEIGYLPLAGDPFDPRHRLHGGLEDEIGAAGVVAAFQKRRTPADPELSTAHEVFELAGARKRGGASGRRPRRRAPGHRDRHGLRDSRPRPGRARRRHRLEPVAVAARARRGGRAGSDHRTDRNQPVGRARGAAGSDRRRPERRAYDAALRGSPRETAQGPGCTRPARSKIRRNWKWIFIVARGGITGL